MSVYGPWSVPPACNSTDQCNEFLRIATPGATGRSFCYTELRPSDATVDQVLGGCACYQDFALGGPNCDETTAAFASVVVCLTISVLIVTMAVLRFAKTLLGLFRYPTIWKMNAAGTSYVFTWVSLLSSWITAIVQLVQAFGYSAIAESIFLVTGRMQIIFMAISILNLAAAFIEMSSSVRLIQNIDKLRIPVVVTVVGISALIVLTYLFTPTLVSAAVGFVVVFFLAMLGIVGPVVMYVRASNRMALAEGSKKLTRCEIISAIFGDVLLNNHQMKRLLGFTKSDTSRDSKDSKDSADISAIHQVSSPRSNHSASFSPKMTHVQRREEKMISFLSRAVTMGVWMCGSLFAFLIFVGVSLIYDGAWNNYETYVPLRVIVVFEDASLVSALYQVLWFLNPGYKKAIAQRRKTPNYRSGDSKDLVPSKDDSKLEAIDDLKVHNSGNSTRPASPAGVHAVFSST